MQDGSHQLKSQTEEWYGQDLPRLKNFDELLDNLRITQMSFQNPFATKLFAAITKKFHFKRTPKELEFLNQCTKDIEFFQEIQKELPKEMILQILKCMKFESYSQYHTLFKQGDFANKFYILIKGGVYILVEKNQLQQSEELVQSIDESVNKSVDQNRTVEKKQLPAQKKKNQELTKMLIELNKGNEEILGDLNNQHQIQMSNLMQKAQRQILTNEERERLEIKQMILKMYPNCILINECQQGQSFGEVALRSECDRTATVVCNQDSCFATISASNYKLVIEQYHNLLYKEKVDFLKEISIFKNWDISIIYNLMRYIQITTFKRGEVIYKENDPSTQIYFIKQGEVELTLPDTDQQFTPNTLAMSQSTTLLKSLIKQNPQQIQRKKHVSITVCILAEHQYFGDFEIFKMTNRITRAQCLSDCEMLYIGKKELIDNIGTLEIISQLHIVFKEREKWYNNLIMHKLKTNDELVQPVLDTRQILHQYQENKSQNQKFVEKFHPSLTKENFQKMQLLKKFIKKSITFMENLHSKKEAIEALHKQQKFELKKSDSTKSKIFSITTSDIKKKIIRDQLSEDKLQKLYVDDTNIFNNFAKELQQEPIVQPNNDVFDYSNLGFLKKQLAQVKKHPKLVQIENQLKQSSQKGSQFNIQNLNSFLIFNQYSQDKLKKKQLEAKSHRQSQLQHKINATQNSNCSSQMQIQANQSSTDSQGQTHFSTQFIQSRQRPNQDDYQNNGMCSKTMMTQNHENTSILNTNSQCDLKIDNTNRNLSPTSVKREFHIDFSQTFKPLSNQKRDNSYTKIYKNSKNLRKIIEASHPKRTLRLSQNQNQ